MALVVGTSSGNKTVAVLTVGTSSGNKNVLIGTVGTASGNKVFFAALTVDIVPGNQADADTAGSHNFSNETANVTGGIGPFTYMWSFSSQIDGVFSFVGSSTTATVTPRVTGVLVGDPASATLNVLVTDTATGLTASDSCVLQYNRL